MTVKEALEHTINTLNGVCVPMALMQTIGEPIATAIGNMRACIDAIDAIETDESREAEEVERTGEE